MLILPMKNGYHVLSILLLYGSLKNLAISSWENEKKRWPTEIGHLDC